VHSRRHQGGGVEGNDRVATPRTGAQISIKVEAFRSLYVWYGTAGPMELQSSWRPVGSGRHRTKRVFSTGSCSTKAALTTPST